MRNITLPFKNFNELASADAVEMFLPGGVFKKGELINFRPGKVIAATYSPLTSALSHAAGRAYVTGRLRKFSRYKASRKFGTQVTVDILERGKFYLGQIPPDLWMKEDLKGSWLVSCAELLKLKKQVK